MTAILLTDAAVKEVSRDRFSKKGNRQLTCPYFGDNGEEERKVCTLELLLRFLAPGVN